ncbi:F-box protein At2g16450-like [Triticum aestivum]|uniref:F-box protein At2g16450-like n=1 Tax=Triticum aestivum TaxID=4565 RepID=UPI001D00BF13|nr:F-box protein At2g16450-like [Triticum aestivum]
MAMRQEIAATLKQASAWGGVTQTVPSSEAGLPAGSTATPYERRAKTSGNENAFFAHSYMEASLPLLPTATAETAVERLTDDLLVEILSRVPAKSLCRFKCVSNHWLSLIHHPEHRKKLPQTPAGFFYGSAITSEWLLKSPVHFTDFPGRLSPPFDTSCTFLPDHRRVELLDCCNGLLLCRWYDAKF